MNKKKNILLLLLFAAILSVSAVAQGHKNLRITEVMIQDSTRGGHGWVELYNSSYSTYAIEKVFITNKKSAELFTENNKKAAAAKEKKESKDAVLNYLAHYVPNSGVFAIPRGDEKNTKVAPRTQVVFDADCDTVGGTFHLPFAFAPGKDNYIALYDVNGELLDEVTVPADLPANNSYAVATDAELPWAHGDTVTWEVRDGSSIAKAITPWHFNTRESNDNIKKFHQGDPYGYIIVVIGISIVFVALLMLFLLFKIFGMVSKLTTKEEDTHVSATTAMQAPQVADVPAPATSTATPASAEEEEIAAICMAMYQHFNAHDEESGVLTFKRNTNTAWTNKAALMLPLPDRK